MNERIAVRRRLRVRGVAARVLEMVKEGEHQRRVEILERQRRRCAAGALLGEAEQQLEGVAVAGDGVRADATLCDQPLEELLQERWEAGRCEGHHSPSCTSSAKCSKRSAAIAISSGTPVRYQ